MAGSKNKGKGDFGDSDPLRKLEKKLYVKEKAPEKKASFRLHIHQKKNTAPRTWDIDDGEKKKESFIGRSFREHTFGKNIFTASLIFFVLSIGIAALVIFRGANVVSPKNVEILVTGPVSVEAGERVTLQIAVENRNNASLEFTDLLIEYPPGTRSPENLEEDLPRVRRTLGDVREGGIASESVQAVFFGEEGSTQNIHLALEYRIRGSNAIFTVDRDYEVHISSSPVRVLIDTFKEVSAGQEFDLKVDITSNSSEVVEDVLVSVDYPFGFSFISASPRPVFDNRIWDIGDLKPGDTRSIVVRGSLEGQDSEEKVFRVASGIPRKDDPQSIGVAYGSSLESVVIARPFLDIKMLFNRDDVDEYVSESRNAVTVNVLWTNNLPTKVLDVVIEARLAGMALDKTSVKPSGGFYRSVDNTIVWDKVTLPALASLEPGQSGGTAFSFTSLPLVLPDGSIIKNPIVEIDVTSKGNRLSETRVPEEVRSTASRLVRFNSDASLTQRAVYHTGPFGNTGSLPPRVDEETTYTIIWTITNSSNDISDGSVRAVLPHYVRWTGEVFPQGERMTFDETTRVLRWGAGGIKAGTGIANVPREVAFRISFIPSVSQLKSAPVLVQNATFTGRDEFTNDALSRTGARVDIRLPTDPQYRKEQGVVVE